MGATGDEHDLSLLLKAYELERLDDIQAASTMLTLLAPTLGLLSLIGFALINAGSLPKWLVALSPLPPLPFIAFGALYAHLAQVRGALLDRYEARLRACSKASAGGLRVRPGTRSLVESGHPPMRGSRLVSPARHSSPCT